MLFTLLVLASFLISLLALYRERSVTAVAVVLTTVCLLVLAFGGR